MASAPEKLCDKQRGTNLPLGIAKSSTRTRRSSERLPKLMSIGNVDASIKSSKATTAHSDADDGNFMVRIRSTNLLLA